WEAATGTKVRQISPNVSVASLMFLPHDRLVFGVSSGWDQNIHVHETETAKELKPPLAHLAAVRAVAVSPDGRHIVSGSYDTTARIWDLEAVKERHAVGAGGLVW